MQLNRVAACMWGWRIIVIAPVAICVALSFIWGKDLNWDALNYHIYLPFSFFENRIHQDFYAAGPQSYLNPIGYSLFYFLIRIFESSYPIAAILAATHSAIFYVLFLVSRLAAPSDICLHSWQGRIYIVLSVLLGIVTTVLLQEIGSSFIDIYIAMLVLGAVYFASTPPERTRNAIFSGFFLGFACGLKLTSIIFSLPVLICIVLRYRTRRIEWLVFMLAAAAGFFLVSGYWMWEVYLRTQNPVFPFFNSIFCSELYYCESLGHYRFTKESYDEILLWPFYVTLPVPWYYTELISPDVRFAALIFLVIGYGLVSYKKGFKKHFSPLFVITIFFFLSLLLWLRMSGNGRYVIALFVMVGPLICAYAYRLLSFGRATCLVLILLVLQITMIGIVKDFRWSHLELADEWYDFELPDELTSTPFLYLSIDKQSLSFLALKVHKDSAFYNISGQTTLPPSEALDNELVRLEEKLRGNVRVLTRAHALDENLNDWIRRINLSLERVGYKIQDANCSFILPKNQYYLKSVVGDTKRTAYMACIATKDFEVQAGFMSSSVRFNEIFNDLEQLCPDWFNPSTSVTERNGEVWARAYVGTDASLSIDKNDVIWIRFSNRILPWSVGNIKTWKEDRKNLRICEYRYPKIYEESSPF